MRIIGPGHPCLLLARGEAADGCDGVILPPGAKAPPGLIHAVEIGDELDIPAKADLLVLPAREITHQPLIEACGVGGLPLALCTRGATLNEITRAVGWHQLAFRRVGAQRAAPLRASAQHAAPLRLEDGSRLIVVHGGGNLRALTRIAGRTFGLVGYEDDDSAGSLAVAAGAVMLIRDADAGFATWAKEVRAAERLLGNGKLPPSPEGTGARRAIVAAREIASGSVIEMADLTFRAGTKGIAPYQAESLTGRKAARNIAAGEPIKEEDIEGKSPEPPEWFSPRPPKQRPSEREA